MKRFLLVFFFVTPAWAQVDFTSNAGFQKTCARYAVARPDSLKTDQERIAYTLCSGVELLRMGAYGMRDERIKNLQGEEAPRLIRGLLESMLTRIRTTRGVLESVKGAGPYLRIEPGTWIIDLDGDGMVTPVERYFFWVPRRDVGEPPRPDQTDEYYRVFYAAPVIKVDRSDVYWALAYCHFAESALNLVLAYDVHMGQGEPLVLLRDVERVRSTAYRSLLAGLQYSRRLRESLAQETDDDFEWIHSPRQKNTSFPLVMDEQTFASWGELLGYLDSLVLGKTLLGGSTNGQVRMRDLTMGICPPGTGINVQKLFLDPIRQPLSKDAMRARCVKSDAATPFTGLPKLIEASFKRNAPAAGRNPSMSGEWIILRHLYWVN